MRKVLVTGATGFIGRHVVAELLQRDEALEITTLSNEAVAPSFDWAAKTRNLRFDLSGDLAALDDSVTPDVLIHLAWEGLPNYKDIFHFERNVPVSYRFVKTLLERGAARVFVAGTCFEYGLAEGCMTEDTPGRDMTNYGFAKDCLRRMLERLVATAPGATLVWGRLFYLYGKGQNPNSFFPLLERAIKNNDEAFNMSGGEQIRDYLPVEDAARRIVSLSLNEDASGVFNICSGKPVSLRTMAERWKEKHHSAIRLNLGYYPYPDYEPLAFWGSDEKLSRYV